MTLETTDFHLLAACSVESSCVEPGNLHVTSMHRQFRVLSLFHIRSLKILEGSCHVIMDLAKLRVSSVNISKYQELTVC